MAAQPRVAARRPQAQVVKWRANSPSVLPVAHVSNAVLTLSQSSRHVLLLGFIVYGNEDGMCGEVFC